ncbi:MAG: type VII secretion protein EssB/YukC [Suipraeoptans sp.]
MEIITEEYKKSELRAQDNYDFVKLERAGEHFLPMKWEDKEESVIAAYEKSRVNEYTEIYQEDYVVGINMLIRISDFARDITEYSFLLKPTNIYYNTCGAVYIKKRDIRVLGVIESNKEFIRQYKALIAWSLCDKYEYNDYLDAGEELYNNNRTTAPLIEAETIDDIIDFLENLKASYIERERSKKIYVSKSGDITRKIMLLILGVAVAALGVYGFITYFNTIPYYETLTMANNAYIENDTKEIIDSLIDVDAQDMEVQQKYILSRAYIQGENLTAEQRENILGKLLISTNEKIMDYWIYIGRLDPMEAENIAMQLSDDELLLYAYMCEKAQIEVDTSLAGSDKESQLKEVQGKIDDLAEKYLEAEEDDDYEEEDEEEEENGDE